MRTSACYAADQLVGVLRSLHSRDPHTQEAVASSAHDVDTAFACRCAMARS